MSEKNEVKVEEKNEVKVAVELNLEDVMKKAKEYAPGVIRRYSLPTNKFCAEDFVGEFLVNFLEKGFDKKFDPAKCNFNWYVYQGLRNTAISLVRKTKYEETSIETLLPNRLKEGAYEIHDEIMIEEVLGQVGDMPFGHDHEMTVVVDGEMYSSTCGSVMCLMMKGYDRQELGKIFKVSASTIDNVIERARQSLAL